MLLLAGKVETGLLEARLMQRNLLASYVRMFMASGMSVYVCVLGLSYLLAQPRTLRDPRILREVPGTLPYGTIGASVFVCSPGGLKSIAALRLRVRGKPTWAIAI